MSDKKIEFKIFPPEKSQSVYACKVSSQLFLTPKVIYGSTPQEALNLAEKFCAHFGVVVSVRRSPAVANSIPIPIIPAPPPVLILIVVVSVVVILAIQKNKSKEDECDEQYEKEMKTCNFLSDNRMRNSCKRQAAERYANCLKGKPLPPFIW